MPLYRNENKGVVVPPTVDVLPKGDDIMHVFILAIGAIDQLPSGGVV